MMVTVSLSSICGGGSMGVDTVQAVGSYDNTILESDEDSKMDKIISTEIPENSVIITEDIETFSKIQEEKIVFEYTSLSGEIIDKITGVSWKDRAPYSIDDLTYLRVSYWGFDEKVHIGELIVHKILAQEVIDIFKELYDAKFMIEKIHLIDEYNAVDALSMEDNNSSALCVREITNKSGELSRHAYGVAIDINPVQNPYISSGVILPKNGKRFIDRTQLKKGMIIEGDVCYNAFVKRGWTWGGNWRTIKDYQHFQKDIEIDIKEDQIPELTIKELKKLITNGLFAWEEMICPQDGYDLVKEGTTYIAYPQYLNSKPKIMSYLREFYSHDLAEYIYHEMDMSDIEGTLSCKGKENTRFKDISSVEVQLVEQSEDKKYKSYQLYLLDKDKNVYIEFKYIGSQGWRINKIINIESLYEGV